MVQQAVNDEVDTAAVVEPVRGYVMCRPRWTVPLAEACVSRSRKDALRFRQRIVTRRGCVSSVGSSLGDVPKSEEPE